MDESRTCQRCAPAATTDTTSDGADAARTADTLLACAGDERQASVRPIANISVANTLFPRPAVRLTRLVFDVVVVTRRFALAMDHPLGLRGEVRWSAVADDVLPVVGTMRRALRRLDAEGRERGDDD